MGGVWAGCWVRAMARRPRCGAQKDQNKRMERVTSRKKNKLVKGQGGVILALLSAPHGLPGTPWRVSSSQLDADGRRIDM
jgi:hypothetical protein